MRTFRQSGQDPWMLCEKAWTGPCLFAFENKIPDQWYIVLTRHIAGVYSTRGLTFFLADGGNFLSIQLEYNGPSNFGENIAHALQYIVFSRSRQGLEQSEPTAGNRSRPSSP